MHLFVHIHYFNRLVKENEMKMFKKLLVTTLIASLLFANAIMLTSCGKQTLEEFVKKDKETKQEIDTMGKTSGMKIKVEENTVIYDYDMGIKLDSKQKKALKDSLDQSMKEMKGTFVKQAKKLQKKAKTDTVEIKVNYLSEKKTVASYTFSSDDK